VIRPAWFKDYYGIGFIGGGTTLKLTQERDILGLTRAAGIWMTAATAWLLDSVASGQRR
jgi:uncharacterized membrane protein YhiD involved in acid resistance